MLSRIEKIKIRLIAEGIKITSEAKQELTKNGEPLSLFEYPTTSGVTLILGKNIYINTRFTGKHIKPKILLDYIKDVYYLIDKNIKIRVNVLLVPRYFDKKLDSGILVRDMIMSHADRMRINPISGCSFRCKFCDAHAENYQKNDIKDIIKSIKVVMKDKNIKSKHLLISGGTPLKKDYEYIDDVYEKVTKFLKKKNIPVDVMMSPRMDIDILDKLKKWGVNGLSINLEVFNERMARKVVPQKAAISREFYFEFIKKAIEIFGKGKVRSLLLLGLEKEKDTLKGVESLAKLGCDVVLSPFVPGNGIMIKNTKPPTAKSLERMFLQSKKIANKYGVVLGPRCIPCQHNTLAFPDRSGKYYFS